MKPKHPSQFQRLSWRASSELPVDDGWLLVAVNREGWRWDVEVGKYAQWPDIPVNGPRCWMDAHGKRIPDSDVLAWMPMPAAYNDKP